MFWVVYENDDIYIFSCVSRLKRVSTPGGGRIKIIDQRRNEEIKAESTS